MDKDVIITYETLYELLRREKSRPEIQKLDDSFYKDVINYIEEKKSFIESQSKKESIFSSTEIEKTKKQLENVQKMLKDLCERREFKIVQLALISSRTSKNIEHASLLLPEEQSFHSELINLLNSSRENILENLLNAKLPKKLDLGLMRKPKEINSASKAEDNKVVRLLNPVPKFIGTNLEVYGPFDQENVVNLPSEIADLLIKNKKAEELKAR
ncbi:MAG: hypothetical protein AABW41_05660 [Nanoarchaeota archaeon]